MSAKSTALAILLALFFGPLGLLYSSVTGAIVMFVLYIASIVVGVMTFGIGLFLLLFIHPICAVWAAVAVNSHNKELLEDRYDQPTRPGTGGSLLGLALSSPVATPPAVPASAQPRPMRATQEEVIACAQCGGALEAGKRFCRYCGSPVSQSSQESQSAPAAVPAAAREQAAGVCAQCGTALTPGRSFCKRCGHPADVPAAAALAETRSVNRVQDVVASLPAAASQTEPRREVVSSSMPNPIPPSGNDMFGRATEAMQASLFEAARQGDFEAVRSLLMRSRDLVFSKDEEDWTALHWAASRGQRGVAELLLASGAQASARALKDRTPLHFAAFGGHSEVVELLLAHRADVNARTRNGETPLHVAGLGLHRDVMDLLRLRGGQL